MIIKDILYGELKVQPVIEELISSFPVQRLKNIHQGGAVFLIAPHINHSRYDHSVGVMHLVNYLGGTIEEQIVALLHDVSHTAFSHVVDYVFKRKAENYHEDIYESIIRTSPIIDILVKHGFSDDIPFKKDYFLLEQPYPFLCADRVDYTLRDLYMANMLPLTEIHGFIKDLTVINGRIDYETTNAESWFKDNFKRLNQDYFRKPEFVYINFQFAKLLKQALETGIIHEADLMNDDHTLLTQLAANAITNKQLTQIKSLKGFDDFDVLAATETLKKREL